MGYDPNVLGIFTVGIAIPAALSLVIELANWLKRREEERGRE